MSTRVKEVMTKKLITIPIGTSTFDAFKLMQEKRIRHLPVIDELDDIVGVLSLKDLYSIASERVPVELIMSSPVEYVDENMSLRSAILKMLEKKISCLLIANGDSDASGIVTTDDLLWHLARLLKEDRPLSSMLNVQTVGQVIDDLAAAGI